MIILVKNLVLNISYFIDYHVEKFKISQNSIKKFKSVVLFKFFI